MAIRSRKRKLFCCIVVVVVVVVVLMNILLKFEIIINRDDKSLLIRFSDVVKSGNRLKFNKIKDGIGTTKRSHAKMNNNTSVLISTPPSCDPHVQPDSKTMAESKYNIPTSAITANNLTVLLLSYSRLNLLPLLVQHYVCMPIVDRLILLWANQDVSPPGVEKITKKCSDRLFIVRVRKNMTSRFAAFKDIRTDGILNIDDDKLMTLTDLQHAFNVWKKHPWGIVGSSPRGYIRTKTDDFIYGYYDTYYAMILTSDAFFHRDYLRIFDDKCVGRVREEIDRTKNCEDIFMNFLVKDHCRCSGVFFVKQRVSELQSSMQGSLHIRKGHSERRSQCLKEYSAMFSSSFNISKSSCEYK